MFFLTYDNLKLNSEQEHRDLSRIESSSSITKELIQLLSERVKMKHNSINVITRRMHHQRRESSKEDQNMNRKVMSISAGCCAKIILKADQNIGMRKPCR